MQIFASRQLTELSCGSPGPCGRPFGGLASRAQDPEQSAGEAVLLLEGSWPDDQRGTDRWSLDDAIDARFAWIDRWAAEHAERLAQWQQGAGDDDRPTLAYLNELALRYFLVKLLRVVAFFDEICLPASGETWQLHLADESDAVYAELFDGLAERHAVELSVHWQGSPGPCGRPSGSFTNSAQRPELSDGASSRAQGPGLPASRQSMFPWRRWLARAAGIFSRHPSLSDDHRPRVILCGSPRVLDPVCAELLARGCRVWWLYEEFAVRTWWKWRAAGVEQLLCDGVATSVENALRGVPRSAVDGAPRATERHGVCSLQRAGRSDATCRGVRLDGAVAYWLSEQAAKHGARQSWWLDRIDEHFRAVQPTVLVLDEDATPFKRAAVAIGRRHGARSLVVQHGAPCGPFGFAPLAADEICVWGESTREQLVEWGIADSPIHVTGWPSLTTAFVGWPSRPSSNRTQMIRTARKAILRTSVSRRRSPRFLLLATVPPDVRRPDTVAFHLTSRNHAAMIEMACAAASRFAGARLTIKLHPRTRDARLFHTIVKRWRQLDIRLIRHGDTARLFSDADCVLSCASTAGIEAALAGAAAVQLLPEGSGDVLPADRWGLIGSARTLEELNLLIDQAIARGWCKAPDRRQTIAATTGARAAGAVVDRVLPSTGTPVAGAEACRCPGVEQPGHRRGSAPATAVLESAA